jgi:hypothetical protein
LRLAIVRPPMADWWLGSRSVLHAGRGPLKYYHVGDSASSPPRRSAQEQTARRAYERTHHGRVAYRSGPRRSAFSLRRFWLQQAQLGGAILGRAVVSSLGGFIRR